MEQFEGSLAEYKNFLFSWKSNRIQRLSVSEKAEMELDI